MPRAGSDAGPGGGPPRPRALRDRPPHLHGIGHRRHVRPPTPSVGLQRRPAFGALVPCTQLLSIASAWMSQRPLKPTLPKTEFSSLSVPNKTHIGIILSIKLVQLGEGATARPAVPQNLRSFPLARSPPSRRRTRRELCGFHLRSACRSCVPAEPLPPPRPSTPPSTAPPTPPLLSFLLLPDPFSTQWRRARGETRSSFSHASAWYDSDLPTPLKKSPRSPTAPEPLHDVAPGSPGPGLTHARPAPVSRP